MGCGGLRPPLSGVEAPVVEAGLCKVNDADLAFLWEFASPDEAMAWLDSGALGVGVADAVFVDGAVVLMATDAATAQLFAGKAEKYTP